MVVIERLNPLPTQNTIILSYRVFQTCILLRNWLENIDQLLLVRQAVYLMPP